jgi:Bifunctional DNA primase/polymerase, N-terminal
MRHRDQVSDAKKKETRFATLLLTAGKTGPKMSNYNEKSNMAGQSNRFSKEPKTPSAQHGDDGFRLLESCETDPNAHELPPPPSDGPQAALEALLRGFDVIQLLADGTPAISDWRSDVIADDALVRVRWIAAPSPKVGGVTDGLIVLALTGPEGVQQYAALASITNTAAILSRAHKWILLFFRLPAGVRSVEGELLPGVEILSSYGYLELPSGGVTDGCCWANRYRVAMAPQWLLDQIEALAASETQTQGNNDMGAGADGVAMFRKGQLNGADALPFEADQSAVDESAENADEAPEPPKEPEGPHSTPSK